MEGQGNHLWFAFLGGLEKQTNTLKHNFSLKWLSFMVGLRTVYTVIGNKEIALKLQEMACKMLKIWVGIVPRFLL